MIIITFFISNSCTSKRASNLEIEINNFISKQRTNFELRLDTISFFNWDELLIAGPYTYLKDVKDYNFKKFPDFATEHDEDIFLGFILQNEGMKWIRLKEYKLFRPILEGGNGGYKTYSRRDCIFQLEK